MRFRIQDVDNERYYQMPKSLFSYAFYADLSVQAKVIYCILKDRMALSRRNGWVETNEDIYLLFNQQEIADILHVNKSTVCREMKRLKEFGLIDTVKMGQGRCYKIYINKIRVPETTKEITDAEEKLGNAALEDARDAALYEAMRHPSATRELQECNSPIAEENSRVANLQFDSCTGATAQLQECNPAVAPVQRNETEYNETEIVNQKNEYHDEEEDARARGHVSELHEISTFYAQNIHPQFPTVPVEQELLAKWLNRYPDEWLIEAIKTAVLYGHPTLQYIGKILEGWQKNGYKVPPVTMEGRAFHKKPQSAQEIVNDVQALCSQMGVTL
ncbi:replication initiator protein A [uncultured Mitsuokella sp.]|uniref:replication initiator protein A n=1 Tax=uncultured Mitsuokella sp. TaxID=453120 RepID=UPI0026370174|nr:replication initiator protein A [uncultured Mitsuokella sp.]